MNEFEKADIIDNFLKKLTSSSMGSLPQILDGKERTDIEKENKYRIVEQELIKHHLVKVIYEPGTNKTVSGFGLFRISPKGIELLMSNKSSLELLMPPTVTSYLNQFEHTDSLKDLIAKDSLDEFFLVIKSKKLNKDLSRQFISLEARFEGVKKEKRKGTITLEELNIEKAKIRDGLLELIDIIEVANEDANKQQKYNSVNELLDDIDFRNYLMSLNEIKQKLKHIHGKLSWRTLDVYREERKDEIKEFEEREKKLLENQELLLNKIKAEFGENVFKLLDKSI